MKLGVVLLLLTIMSSCGGFPIGINYGQLGSNLSSPLQSINLIQTLIKVSRIKIYDTNPQILHALTNTKIQVSVMLPNQAIQNISATQEASDSWVKTNILPFYPLTRIRTILVGNEVLSDSSIEPTWTMLVPAMQNIKRSLRALGIHNIKVGTPLAMDVLKASFPPSSGAFRDDIAETVMRPILQFLKKTKSFFFLDAYPYLTWADNLGSIDLNYTLFMNQTFTYKDPNSGLVYRNLLDQMVDAIVSAMAKLGYPRIRITIAETGWPNAGDVDQIGANIYNAAHYNRNLIRKLTTREGTPMRPNQTMFTYIFSLYNEDQKPGRGTERHWGLLYPNGSRVFEIDLNGRKLDSEYEPLPEPVNNEEFKGKIWCVVVHGANVSAVGPALDHACAQGNGTCDAIKSGRECYEPNTIVGHASYAFNAYWQRFRKSGGTCYFDGLAEQTAVDPSHGSCNYPAA
ncbi:hypothetical protein AMTRI_Chr06g195210 [Amborella trichopoda]